MTNYRDNAIVLRTYKLGEADRIIVLLTEHHGKVRAVAKGVRKTTSKIGARLEPLNHVDVLLHRGRDLDTVSQVDLLSASNDLRSDLDVLTAGMALLEGADHMTQDREACPQTYRMLLGAIRTLAQGSSPPFTGRCSLPKGCHLSSTDASPVERTPISSPSTSGTAECSARVVDLGLESPRPDSACCDRSSAGNLLRRLARRSPEQRQR